MGCGTVGGGSGDYGQCGKDAAVWWERRGMQHADYRISEGMRLIYAGK